MRFLLDQNVEARIGSFLNDHGHDATRVGVDYPAGLPDWDVLATAHRERRILVTNDKDFGDLIFQQGLPHDGVILFRLPMDASGNQKIGLLEQLLTDQPDQLARFVVVTPQGVRRR